MGLVDRLDTQEVVGNKTPLSMDTLHSMGMVTRRGSMYILTSRPSVLPPFLSEESSKESDDESDSDSYLPSSTVPWGFFPS